jgi:anaerobic ribonucleoside-triphosphate reductase activating protein
MKIRLYKYLKNTKVEGPGTRFCLWVQGCPIHCEGCWAKETWPMEGGQLFHVDDIYNMVKEESDIEGITFLGGEPFAQADALYELGVKVKGLGLSIVTFTGYTYESILEADRKEWNDLLSITDLLIDGPFEKDKFELSRPWVGSSNQNYRFLTPKYESLSNKISSIKNKVEVRICENGVFS